MYSSISNLKDAMDIDLIIQLVNDENRGLDEIYLTDNDDLCTSRINECINKADTEINGYLAAMYTLPLTAIPDLIENYSVEISIYYLYKRRHRADMPESVMSIYKGIIDQLKEIQKGLKVVPGLSIVSTTEGAGEFRVNKTSTDRVFSKDVLDKY